MSVPKPGRSLRGLDLSEEPVGLVVRPGGEEQRVRRPGVAAVAELERPEPVDDDRLAIGPSESSLELEAAIRLPLVRVDAPVAEVPHEQVAPELSETLGRLGQPPRRVEQAAGGNPTEERTARVEPV